MSIHCISYICNRTHCLAASIATLLGLTYALQPAEASARQRLDVALLGDSMTWIGGDSCENPTGWSHFLKESGVADTIEVYARSGATWTNTSSTHRDAGHYSEVLHDDNVVYNQAVRLLQRADTSCFTPSAIILFAGANDAWFASRRPGIFGPTEKGTGYGMDTLPSDVTSLYGSVALTCDLLRERFPDSRLIIVTPLQMSKTDADTIMKVSDIIEEAGRSRDCTVIRADRESGITHLEEARKPRFTYDGVHTNPEGARLVGELIIRGLREQSLTDGMTRDNTQSTTIN